MSLRPARLQAVSSSSVASGSSSMCTAMIRSARIVFAYCSAWIVFASNVLDQQDDDRRVGSRFGIESGRRALTAARASSRSY